MRGDNVTYRGSDDNMHPKLTVGRVTPLEPVDNNNTIFAARLLRIECEIETLTRMIIGHISRHKRAHLKRKAHHNAHRATNCSTKRKGVRLEP